MKGLINYFRSYEEVKIGNDTINIEHSPLENILGCGLGVVALAVTSPIWITYGLYSAGKYGYNKFKEKSIKKE